MMEILQRQAHQQEAEEASSGEEDEVDADDGCLPEETLSKLVMQACLPDLHVGCVYKCCC